MGVTVPNQLPLKGFETIFNGVWASISAVVVLLSQDLFSLYAIIYLKVDLLVTFFGSTLSNYTFYFNIFTITKERVGGKKLYGLIYCNFFSLGCGGGVLKGWDCILANSSVELEQMWFLPYIKLEQTILAFITIYKTRTSCYNVEIW